MAKINVPGFVRTTKTKYTANITRIKNLLGADLANVDQWSTWTDEAKQQAGKEYANNIYFCTDTGEMFHREVGFGSSATDKANIEELMNAVFPLVVTATPSSFTYEKGSHNNPQFTVKVTLKGSTLTINDITLKVDGVKQSSLTCRMDPITENRTYNVNVTRGAQAKSINVSANFYNKKYLGTVTSTTISSTNILSLEKNGWATDKKFGATTLNCSGGKYIVVAFPTSVATDAEIWVGGLRNTDVTKTTISVQNSSGYSENYTVIRLNQKLNASAVSVEIK